MSDETTMLPCPFCGGEAETVGDDYMEWIAECVECCASSMTFATEAEAIAAWNTRAEMGYEDTLILLDELGLSEQTCKFVDDSDGEPSPPKCSVCGYDPGIYECAWYEDGTYGYERNYCPNCGARVKN